MQDAPTDSQTNGKKLFFGNLPFSVNDDGLRELVADFGEIVDAKVISDFNTGRSKGFGFVEFASAEVVQEVIKALDNYELEGRNINVKVALPKKPRSNDRGGYRRGGDRRGGDRRDGNSRGHDRGNRNKDY